MTEPVIARPSFAPKQSHGIASAFVFSYGVTNHLDDSFRRRSLSYGVTSAMTKLQLKAE
jgi:hypothetical protein